MSTTLPASQSKVRKITLIILGVVLIGTVFLLPQIVTEPWVAGDTAELPAVPEASPSSVSPSTAAELTLYRQESQGVLAEIMAIRDELRQSQVGLWAEVEFQQALDMVEAGDERYSYGDYEASLEQFRQARSRLVNIKNLGRQKLDDAKIEIEAAIEALNLNVATANMNLASTIAPQDPEVQKLAPRVEVLAQVAAHIEAGDEAQALDRIKTAQAEYRKATDLDPLHQRAVTSLAFANKEVTNSTFRAHMSKGFASLESQDFDAARSAFLEAGKIYPGSAEVKKAIAQVNNRESGNFVNRELERALDLELREEWQESVSIYEALLEQDPSLTDARVRLIPVRVRADLDKRMSRYIEEPLRMSSKKEYDAAQVALQNARGIANPGPRLDGQIVQLESLLKIANSPVEVVFRSDNQTRVVLYRVAELGQFEQVTMKLRPGKYVAAGTRIGFRDVRVEFTVTGQSLQAPVEVRCEDPVG